MRIMSVIAAVVEKSQQSYQEAFDIAKDKMQPTHPIRYFILDRSFENDVAEISIFDRN